MSFRTHLLVVIAAIALLPLTAIGLLVRREMDRRFAAQDAARTRALAAVTTAALAERDTSIARRLSSLASALANDDQFRAAVRGGDDDQTYILDYATHAMPLSGLSMLEIVNDSSRVISSGQFRNDYGRLDTLPPPGRSSLDSARTPGGRLQVLARTDSVRIGGHRFMLVGGMAVTPEFLATLSPDSTFAVSLVDANGVRPVITRRTNDLDALRASVDRWFLTTIGLAVAGVLLVALWLSRQLSAPLAALAEQTARVDLDHLDVDFAAGRTTARDDEIGALARLLNAMTRRLRQSAARLRDAERRATVGDLARQVTHDIKNGLAPIRHVLRHLAEVERDTPDALPTVFAERRQTLDASVTYLDELARQYARLTPSVTLRPSDANGIIRDVAVGTPPSTVTLALAPDLPLVAADPLVLRRIIENLVANAIDAGGTVTIATQPPGNGQAPRDVIIVVADTGRGMTQEQLARASADFFTTKPDGTGLGLSIVRRLVTDLHGTLSIDTAPGAGTRVRLTIPRA
jgi:signal transduction histidine kinase